MENTTRLLDGFIPIGETADQLGVHVRTLKRWKNQHYGPSPVHIGKRIFYRRADIAAWLAGLGTVSHDSGRKPRNRRSQQPNFLGASFPAVGRGARA
jgi:predicted DNA-binding transcriptional regulator AlpA